MAKAILPMLITCICSEAENCGCFYEPPGVLVTKRLLNFPEFIYYSYNGHI